MEVILGIDFGTSGIKIGYWDGNTESYPVLVAIGDAGDLFVYKHSPNDSENIKIDILDKYASCDLKILDTLKDRAISVLTKALSKTKKYLDKIQVSECRFSISSDNIKYDDEKKDFWDDIFNQSLKNVGWGDIHIGIYEEIKCVLATYYKSYEKDNNRMHWIADMGHGTLDIVCFIYHSDKVNVLVNSVEQNGIIYCEKSDFKTKIKNQFEGMYSALKNTRNPKSIHFDFEKYNTVTMPLVITGGGGEKYKNFFKNIFTEEKNRKISEFNAVLLEGIDFAADNKDYMKARFAVLCGLLTYDVEDLELKEPHKIEDITDKEKPDSNNTGVIHTTSPRTIQNIRNKTGYIGD